MFTKSHFGSIAAVAAILTASSVSAQHYGGTNGASQYPEVTRAVKTAPIERDCTQLESAAGVAGEDCGRLTVSEVVKIMSAQSSSD